MNRKEEIIETVKKQFNENVVILEESDTFEFKCQQCGSCCMHRRDVIINPFDVFNGARYLGITPKDFMEQNCYVTLGSNSKIPMVLLESTPDKGWCPLLQFDVKDGGKFKCSINPAKPSVCKSHPLGSVWSTAIDTNEKEKFYIKVDQCPNSLVNPDTQSVKDWMNHEEKFKEEYAIAHELQTYNEKFFNMKKLYWSINYIINGISPEDEHKAQTFNVFKAKVVDLLGIMLDSYTSITYADFDINKPYIEQAEAAKKELDDMFSSFKKVVDSIDEALKECDIDIDELLKNMDKEGE